MSTRPRHNAARVLPAARPPRATRCGPWAGGGGFTLVEVLVVISILAILAAIVASVAGYVMNSASRQESAATQKVLMAAVQAYYDAANSKVYPADRYNPSDPDPDPNGVVLMNYLTGHSDPSSPSAAPTAQTPAVKAATEILLKLPQEAWDGNWNSPVRDGWRNAMRYEVYDPKDPNRGGLGGKPVVISAGPDGRFGKADPGYIDDATKEEDNIRSDESQ